MKVSYNRVRNNFLKQPQIALTRFQLNPDGIYDPLTNSTPESAKNTAIHFLLVIVSFRKITAMIIINIVES